MQALVSSDSDVSDAENTMPMLSPKAELIASTRYFVRTHDGIIAETSNDMFRRVATSIANVEHRYGTPPDAIETFRIDLLRTLRSRDFIPAGRTLANAGAPTPLVANCVVLHIGDSMREIFDTLSDAAELQKRGAGLGFPLHLMRPAGAKTIASFGESSGPISFLKVYNQAFGVIKQQNRHGANMAVMRVDHPDILEFVHCFTEDAQVLTSKGFMFREEIFAALADDPTFLVAAYDQKSSQIVYERPLHIIDKASATHSVVEFTHVHEAALWAKDAEGHGDEKDKGISNGVSLIVTEGHDMLVKLGHIKMTKGVQGGVTMAASYPTIDGKRRKIDIDYAKVRAVDLVSDDERVAIRFNAQALNGPRVTQEDILMRVPLLVQLGLAPRHVEPLLKLYGYWLGDGSLARQRDKKGCDGITFCPTKIGDRAFLAETFANLDLVKNVDFYQYVVYAEDEADREMFVIFKREWIVTFFDQYIEKYALNLNTTGYGTQHDEFEFSEYKHEVPHYTKIKSGKWCWSWVWGLSQAETRYVLDGLVLADGNTTMSSPVVYTSSVTFRDEIMRLMLHAGLSARFIRLYKKGAIRGTEKTGAIIASADAWMVSSASSSSFAEPIMYSARDIKRGTHTGRVWCLEMPSGTLIARRAKCADGDGIVTLASRPIVVGNCKSVEGDIKNFNISVGFTHAFMEQARTNSAEPWMCHFGGKQMLPRRIVRDANFNLVSIEPVEMTARALLDEIVDAAWRNGEPGCVFLDTANDANPVPGLGRLESTNPCGESKR